MNHFLLDSLQCLRMCLFRPQIVPEVHLGVIPEHPCLTSGGEGEMQAG